MSRVGTMQTLACEACRKRKVRCSGSTPCVNCQKHMTECYFELNRRRRGPRPKQRPITENHHSPEPAAADAEPSSTPPLTVVQRREAQNVSLSTDWIEARITPFNLNMALEWKEGIRRIVGSTSYILNDEVIVTVDETLHLALIFCATVNSQQCPIISPGEFLSRLGKGTVARCCLHAICASSVRFSWHSKCRAVQLADSFAADARGILASTYTGTNTTEFDRILTLSTLSMYEAYQGNGLQAWYDMTTALSAAASLKHSGANDGDSNAQAAVEMIQRYLQTLGTFLSMGHAIQPLSLGLNELAADALSNCISGRGPSPCALTQLLAISHRILTLANKDVTNISPAPWSKDSAFMAIKRSLDTFYILHSNEISSCVEILESLQDSEAEVGELVLCSSLFHANTILLNRIFLPVSIVPVVPEQSHEHPRSQRESLFFPAAVPTFWKERVAACVSSARGTVQLCTAVLDQGMFMLSPMLGYTLYLSGLVFLNQLQVEVDPSCRTDHISNLKTIFTVLGAMRQFFAPAYVWTDTLLRVHGAEAISEAIALTRSPSSLFANFMARFTDITEPPFCPMSPLDIQAVRNRMEQATAAEIADCKESENRTQLNKARVRQSERDIDVEGEIEDADIEGAGQNSVLDVYSQALEDAIENIDGPTEIESIFSAQKTHPPQPREDSVVIQAAIPSPSCGRLDFQANQLNLNQDIHEILNKHGSGVDSSLLDFELPDSALTAAEVMRAFLLEPQGADLDLGLEAEFDEHIDHDAIVLGTEPWLPQL